MSKKKSLGSSPIGFQSNSSSMGFIPDLGVSESRKTVKSHPSSSNGNQRFSSTRKKTKKEIVSYSLEPSLIARVKTIADQKDMYYSSLVSKAIRSWIAENG